MPTPKYHVYLEYAEPEKSGCRFNITHEELVRTFSSPVNEGKTFWFLGRLLNPIKVTKALVFWSYESADQLILPTHENMVASKDKKYAAECIEHGKVKGAYDCTEKYLTKPQTAQTLQASSGGAERRRVMVDCGGDNEMKELVTSALRRLLLVPVMLNEEPAHARKIVTQPSDYTDANLALVLLSADCYVYNQNEEATKRKLKPASEVIFNLGYLLGKLGRDKVLVFYRENPTLGFSLEGLKAVAFDDLGSWKLALTRELCACGYQVEADRILK